MGSTKNSLSKAQLISAGDMTGDLTSSVLRCQFLDNVAFELVWTGTPVGNFTVQTSVDHVEDSQGNVSVPGNWVALPLSSSIAAAGSGDTAFISINQIPSPYLRVVYTHSSGTGTLDAYASGKEI